METKVVHSHHRVKFGLHQLVSSRTRTWDFPPVTSTSHDPQQPGSVRRTGSASLPLRRAEPGLVSLLTGWERQRGPVRGHGGKHAFHWVTLGHVTKYGALVLPASGSFQARRLNTQIGSQPESRRHTEIGCQVWVSSRSRGASSTKTITAGTR